MNKSQKGFGLIYSLVIVIVIAAIVVAGVLVYRHDHNKTNNSTASDNSSQQTAATNSSSQATDPYAGWKTADLKYEKASFKYPTTWSLSNTSTVNGTTGNVSPGSDSAKLTSPTGLELTINTGVTGIGDGLRDVLDSHTMTTLGNDYFLDFYTNSFSDATTAQGACVGTTSSHSNYPYSKNIVVTNNPVKPYDVICMQYPKGQGNIEKPVSAFKADSSYAEAKLIIESLAY
ncbi:MAG TPA: hypothetical protein VHD84_03640 [Candidatus Saccharimonadales bacterium]|nr:hypothetical protein [Candidatus Saccharimonadales bacterium]